MEIGVNRLHTPDLVRRLLNRLYALAKRRMRHVCLGVNRVGEPDAGNPHVRFDERGTETDRLGDTAPSLDSTRNLDKEAAFLYNACVDKQLHQTERTAC